jgi:hypothetical protein
MEHKNIKQGTINGHSEGYEALPKKFIGFVEFIEFLEL